MCNNDRGSVPTSLSAARSVQLTAAGAAKIPPAQEILAAAERAKASTLAASRGEVGTVKLAYAGASNPRIGGSARQGSPEGIPGKEFRPDCQDFTFPALARVLRSEVDISLGRWDFVPAGVQSRIIVEDHLVMAVPASHRLAFAWLRPALDV